MSLLKANWKSLYKLQDEVLLLLKDQLSVFYLTGGTALSRYYLNHRYSEDLDFFCHEQGVFEQSVNKIAHTLARSQFLKKHDMQISETYARLFVGTSSELKIDFVYENVEHIGVFKKVQGINIDNPQNILANKICCILGRDEPKDVFDIVSIAENYSFNWKKMILVAKRKQLLDETDLVMRLESFPIEWLANVSWVLNDIDIQAIGERIRQITQDILLEKDNSFGVGKQPLNG